ncbi:hypothetical protein MMPV_002205 [Pyropia vietnamensis]
METERRGEGCQTLPASDIGISRRLSAPEAPIGRGSLGAPEMDVYSFSSGPRYAHPYGSGLVGGGGDPYREAYAQSGYGLPTPPGEASDRPLPPLLQPPPPGVQYVVPGRGGGSARAGTSAGGGTVAFVRGGGGGGGGGASSDAEVADVDRRVGGGGEELVYPSDYAARGGLAHSSRGDDARPVLEVVDSRDLVGVGGALLGRGGRMTGVGGPRGVPSIPTGAAVVAAATAAGRCTECGLVLSPGASLARHMRLAHGGAGGPSAGGTSEGSTGRKFTCSQCTQAFKRRYDLQEHTRQVHLKSEPFQCDQCGVPFGRKFDLKRHTASVHDRVRAFVCPRCHQRFAQKTNMMRHVERVHRQSPPRASAVAPVPLSAPAPGGGTSGKAACLAAVTAAPAVAPRTRLVCVDAVAAGTPDRLYGCILRGLAWRGPPPPRSGAPADGGAFVRAVATLLGRPELDESPGVEVGEGGANDTPNAHGKRGRAGGGGGSGGGGNGDGLPPVRFVVAIRRAERLRHGDYPPGVLATLCRLGAAVAGRRPLTVVFLSEVGWASSAAGPPLPSVPTMTTVFFPPYSQAELADVLSAMIGPAATGSAGVGPLKKAERALWPGFLNLTLSVLAPSGADARELSRVIRELWADYIAPVRNGSRPSTDGVGLFENFRPRLQSVLNGLYRRTLPVTVTAGVGRGDKDEDGGGAIPWDASGAVVNVRTATKATAGGTLAKGMAGAVGTGGWTDLPGPTRLLLLAAYLGYHTAPRRDHRLHGGGGRRRGGARTAGVGSAGDPLRRYPVPLERLLGLYRSLVGMGGVADDVAAAAEEAAAAAAERGRPADGEGERAAGAPTEAADPTAGGIAGAYAVDTRLLGRLRGLLADGWVAREGGGGEALDEPRYRVCIGRAVARALAVDAGIDLTMFFQE